jgi:uncharacterized membrane protein
MAHRTLTLAIFENETAADNAAMSLKDSGVTSGDAMGVLALDAEGHIREDKVGARSSGKGAGVGALLWLLGPVGVGVGVAGGAAAGALHHKGLGLDEADRDRISRELTDGKAAVGVLTKEDDAAVISSRLAEAGGTPEQHAVSDEGLQAAGDATAQS